MALKAGRVGVASGQVDPVNGKLLGDKAEYPEGVMNNSELTASIAVAEDKVTTEFTVDGGMNNLIKFGKVVQMNFGLSGVTATAWTTVLGTIPEGFRPKHSPRVPSVQNTGVRINTDGTIQSIVNLSNAYINVSATWITS